MLQSNKRETQMSGQRISLYGGILLAGLGAFISYEGISHAFINNGVLTAESSFPSVLQIVISEDGFPAGTCTGVAVSKTQVLTAGHCADGDLSVYGVKAATLKVDVHPKYLAAQISLKEKVKKQREELKAKLGKIAYDRQLNPLFTMEQKMIIMEIRNRLNIREEIMTLSQNDMAVITLDNTANLTPSTFYQAPLKVGDKVQLVGYGVSGYTSGIMLGGSDFTPVSDSTTTGDDGDSGRLRSGTNVIASLDRNMITVVGALASPVDAQGEFLPANGDTVTPNHGDSGGPLFLNGQIIGLVHGGGLTDDNRSIEANYSMVSLDTNKAFISSIVK